jgi:DNA-binding transcriptional regulator YhcF (GntR family)
MRIETYNKIGQMIAARDVPDEAGDPTASDLAKAVVTIAQRTGLTKTEADALLKPVAVVKP